MQNVGSAPQRSANRGYGGKWKKWLLLYLAVGALPDFLPRFVALEEAPFIEEINSLFVEVWMRMRHTIRCSDAIMNGNGSARNFGSSIFTARYSSVLPESRIASKLSNHSSATPS